MKTCALLGCLLASLLAALPAVQAKPPPKNVEPVPYNTMRYGQKPPPGVKKPAPKAVQASAASPPPILPRQAEVLDCGSHTLAEGSSYVIQSPRYPDNYPNNYDCSYLLTAAPGMDVTLSCTQFRLEGSRRCRYDWLKVNGEKYCGRTPPPLVVASSLAVEFHTDYSVVRSGFQCSVSVEAPISPPVGSVLACGTNNLLARGEYTVESGEYTNDIDCFYKLTAAEDGDDITISCSAFDVEAGYYRCEYDWLSINGQKFCGSAGPSGVSSHETMDIHWHTDYSVVRDGFRCQLRVGAPPPPPPPLDCSCGNVNRASRIVGGVETEQNEYPWQAGLVSTGGDRTWCGGTVINSRYVMTAAHCTVDTAASRIQVLIREHGIGVSDGEIRANVQQIIIHPNYAGSSYDFSLLKLAEPLDFPSNNLVAPACLPAADNDFTGADGVVTGWGTTSSGGSQAVTLQEVTVPIISNSACSAAYSSYTIDGSMICAGLLGTGGKDSCQGDSGGPLVSLQDGRYALAGVVSWGIGCARPEYPGVYARVTAVLPWIAENAADGQYCSDGGGESAR